MDDDLNTADAIASIFELVRDINTNVVGKTPSKALVKGAIAMFDELTGVLGLVYNRKTETLDSDVEALIAVSYTHLPHSQGSLPLRLCSPRRGCGRVRGWTGWRNRCSSSSSPRLS